MWIRPCHRQETEDIPDCLLGATITTGGSIMTEDLRMQKKKTHKQTSSHTETQTVRFMKQQQRCSDMTGECGASLSPLCVARQQLWQACRKENNNRQSRMTQWRRERDPSCSTSARREQAAVLWTSDRAVKCFGNISDAHSGFLQAPWHHAHYTNIFWHQEANEQRLGVSHSLSWKWGAGGENNREIC